MAMDESDERHGRSGRRRMNGSGGDPDEGGKADVAFDLWLKRSLHQMYDAIASEPIPPELLRMIEDDRARRRG